MLTSLLLNILLLEIAVREVIKSIIVEEIAATTIFGDCHAFVVMIAVFVGMGTAMIAYRKNAEKLEIEKQKTILEQNLQRQKIYMQEMQKRYALTRSFRHDIKNHFLVIHHLLSNGQVDSAKEYLKSLEQTAAALSFSVQTGNVALDALLNNKLGLAQQSGVQVECEVALSPQFNIDDVDLCVIFANAVDNAAKACAVVESKKKYIRLTSARKGKFFMIVVENSQDGAALYPKGDGLGLHNIQAVVDKYRGALSTESRQDYFCLNVLLVIS